MPDQRTAGAATKGIMIIRSRILHVIKAIDVYSSDSILDHQTLRCVIQLYCV